MAANGSDGNSEEGRRLAAALEEVMTPPPASPNASNWLQEASAALPLTDETMGHSSPVPPPGGAGGIHTSPPQGGYRARYVEAARGSTDRVPVNRRVFNTPPSRWQRTR